MGNQKRAGQESTAAEGEVVNAFPKAALAQHIAVLGKTGSGKSYAVRGIVEGLLDDNARVCIIDPTGAWNGLRSSATGKSAGYPVVIFGGEHADLELGYQTGEALAEIIGTSSTPAILDTSLMKVSARTRFFADFADALVRRNKGPLQLIIDEAHLFAPQGKVNDPQSGAMLHAANNLVSLGRSRGLRIILITQRPAKLHKDSLTQVETLVAMRLIAPQDRRAVEDWIEDNADEKKGREIIESLATLKTGDGWVWAPELGVLERIHFPKIKTFDSGRAPDGSEAKGQVLAPIDREAIAQQLKAVAADALANDPTALKKRIAELERQVNQHRCPEVSDAREIERRAHATGYAQGTSEIRDRMNEILNLSDQLGAQFLSKLRDIKEAIEQAVRAVPVPSVKGYSATARDNPALGKPAAPIKRSAPSSGNGHASEEIGTGGKRRMMTVLAQYPEGMRHGKLSILTGLSSRSGTWSTYLGELRSKGYVEGRDHLKATDAGLQALGDWQPLPTGRELIEYWRQRLGESGKRKIFDVAIAAYPNAVATEEVAEQTGLSARSGTWSTYLGELRTLGLITGRGEIRASEDLFSWSRTLASRGRNSF